MVFDTLVIDPVMISNKTGRIDDHVTRIAAGIHTLQQFREQLTGFYYAERDQYRSKSFFVRSDRAMLCKKFN